MDFFFHTKKNMPKKNMPKKIYPESIYAKATADLVDRSLKSQVREARPETTIYLGSFGNCFNDNVDTEVKMDMTEICDSHFYRCNLVSLELNRRHNRNGLSFYCEEQYDMSDAEWKSDKPDYTYLNLVIDSQEVKKVRQQYEK